MRDHFGFAAPDSVWETLPEAITESITACGVNRTLPMYRIAAQELERAIDGLRSSNIHQFALVLTQGTVRLKQRLKLTDENATDLDIVIAGQSPTVRWTGMTQPPTAAELTTHVNLAEQSISILARAQAAVCLENLHLYNGKVRQIVTRRLAHAS